MITLVKTAPKTHFAIEYPVHRKFYIRRYETENDGLRFLRLVTERAQSGIGDWDTDEIRKLLHEDEYAPPRGEGEEYTGRIMTLTGESEGEMPVGDELTRIVENVLYSILDRLDIEFAGKPNPDCFVCAAAA